MACCPLFIIVKSILFESFRYHQKSLKMTLPHVAIYRCNLIVIKENLIEKISRHNEGLVLKGPTVGQASDFMTTRPKT